MNLVLVDDDANLLLLYRTTLKAAIGCDVQAFDSPLRFLEALPTLPRVDAVISDWTMPGMSGLELAASLQARTPPVPVILLTAADAPATAPEGVAAVLRKPCPARTIAATVSAVLGSRASATTAAGAEAGTSGDRLSAIRRAYRQHLRGSRTHLEALLAESTPEAEAALRQLLHQLAGTSGSYGMASLMNAAVELRGVIVRRANRDAEAARLLRELDQASEDPT